MSQPTTKDTTKSSANTSTKRSRWKFFPKERKSTEPVEPDPKPKPHTPPSTDSTYGSSGPNSAQPSDNENSTNSSLTIHRESTRSPISPPPAAQSATQPPAQPGLLSPQDAAAHQEQHRYSPDATATVTTPTVRKETRQDPSTGNVITIVTTTTTTTTTTTVTGPNGTTVIEEPAELGDGRRTPEPRTQSEAVTAAINGQGDGSLHHQFEDNGPRPTPGQWIPYTPGRRIIPQRESNSSMTDVRLSGIDEHVEPTIPQQEEVAPRLPPRVPSKSPLNPNRPEEQNPATLMQNTAPNPALPPRSVNRKPVQTQTLPQPVGHPTNGETTPISPLGMSRNFSYPTKNQSQSWAQVPQPVRPDAPAKSPSSKLANLKMAAAGLHGVGEALRGTISQSADTYIPGGKVKDDRMAQHQEVINRGRYEIENRKFAPQNGQRFYLQDPARPQAPHPGQPNLARPQAPFQGQPNLARPQAPHPGQPNLARPQGPNPPQPDSPPTHVQLSRRRLSGGYDVQPIPKEEPPQVRSGIGKWLHKAKSHPSDKNKDSGLRRQDKPPEPNNGKLRRRSKQYLAPVAE